MADRAEFPGDAPPHLRDAEVGLAESCGTCWMFDETQSACWRFGNHPVRDDQVCDVWESEAGHRAEVPMPYVVVEDRARCPVGRPWAVKKEGTDRTYGCHPTKERAAAQQRALYANEAKSQGAEVPPMPEVTDITDPASLIEAIREATRGALLDERRAKIIGRAKELGHPDLLPDNWNADGTLADRSGAWEDDEQRETYNDLCRALSDALDEQVDGWACLIDFDDNNVYYLGEGCVYSAPYSIDDNGPVTLGDSQRVRPQTSYVPASPTRAAKPKIELRHMAEYRKNRAEALTKRRGRDTERRMVPGTTLELRDADEQVLDGDHARKLLVFDGYASLFNRGYKVGPFEETMASGAFKRSLGNPSLDTVLRIEHNDLPLARTTGRITLSDGSTVPTLRLNEDDQGLHVRALLDPEDPDVKRLIPKYRRGDLKEMSFAFRCMDDEWSEDYSQRTVKTAEIHRGDVSIVTYGSSSTTSSTMRSEQVIAELRSIGAEGLVGSLQEFAFQWVASYYSVNGRAATIAELEDRAGKVLSSTSMDTLQQVLSLISAADDAVDEAQPLLADLMGVPNPDGDDDDDDGDDDGDDDERALAIWDQILRAEKSTAPGDAARTAPHLFDSTLNHLAHAKLHAERLDQEDVRSDDQSHKFNHEHLMTHLDQAQDHADRLGQHLEENASDPEVFRTERDRLNSMRTELEETEEPRRDVSTKERENLAKQGKAMPDGSFPIANIADLKNAIQAFGRAKNQAAAKRHIIKRARALGATNLLPESWNVSSNAEALPEARYDEFEAELRAIGGRR